MTVLPIPDRLQTYGIVTGVILGIIALLGAGEAGRRKMLPSIWPVRMVLLRPARISYQQGFTTSPQPKQVSVKVEILKRTDGPLSKVYATVDGEILDLLKPYSQPQAGISEQTLNFGKVTLGTSPERNLHGSELVVIVECRLRKGRWAIRKKVPIEPQ